MVCHAESLQIVTIIVRKRRSDICCWITITARNYIPTLHQLSSPLSCATLDVHLVGCATVPKVCRERLWPYGSNKQ